MDEVLNNDEIRLRVIIDRDMGDVFDRLANTKRRTREVVHLLRLGVCYERLLNGGGPILPASQSAAPSTGQLLPRPGQPTPRRKMQPKPQPPDLFSITGLTPDYFDGPAQS